MIALLDLTLPMVPIKGADAALSYLRLPMVPMKGADAVTMHVVRSMFRELYFRNIAHSMSAATLRTLGRCLDTACRALSVYVVEKRHIEGWDAKPASRAVRIVGAREDFVREARGGIRED